MNDQPTGPEDDLADLHARSARGELLAADVRDLAGRMGANLHLDVRLFAGKDEAVVVGCVIDPATGQCENYFKVPDPTGHLLASILKDGKGG